MCTCVGGERGELGVKLVGVGVRLVGYITKTPKHPQIAKTPPKITNEQ